MARRPFHSLSDQYAFLHARVPSRWRGGWWCHHKHSLCFITSTFFSTLSIPTALRKSASRPRLTCTCRGCAQNINTFVRRANNRPVFRQMYLFVSKDTASKTRTKYKSTHHNSATFGTRCWSFVSGSLNPGLCRAWKHQLLDVSLTHCQKRACRDNNVYQINSGFSTVEEDRRKVSRFLKINIYFISLWYGLHGNCWRNGSQRLIHWRWCSVGEGEILNNYCLCSLLGTHGGGAREGKTKEFCETF